MTSDFDNRAKDIFVQAIEMPESARDKFLTDACADDHRLMKEVETLLEHFMDDQSGILVSPPGAPGVAGAIRQALHNIPKQPFEIGDQVGQYGIRDHLGEGGMSLVYRAFQSTPVRRDVALKVLKPGMDSGAIVSRFETERQVLAAMDHPNIAKIFDAGVTQQGLPYFVMELVRGTPIDVFCNDRRLDVNERIDIFLDVCRAVRHAHMRGIIHRDLKPTNILVAEHEGVYVPKIIDFGVSRALHSPGDERHTKHGQPLGTPMFMSPEQWTSELDLDVRADVYSLGVVLYFLLSGGYPYPFETVDSRNHNAVREAMESAEPHRLSSRVARSKQQTPSPIGGFTPATLAKTVSGDLDSIVLKALSKERLHRYGSVEAFAEDLKRHRVHLPIQARPPSVLYRCRKFCRRHQALSILCAFGVLVLTIGLAALAYHSYIIDKQLQIKVEALALADSQMATADATIQFLAEDVLGLSAPNKLGRTGTLGDLIREISPRINERFADRPEVAARLYFELGKLCVGAGGHGPAALHFGLAQERLEQAHSLDTPFSDELIARRARAMLVAGKIGQSEERIAFARESVLNRIPHPVIPESLALDRAEDLAQFCLWDALALSYDAEASSEQAIEIWRPLMVAAKHGGGFRHDRMLISRADFAHALRSEGHYQECLDIAESAIADAVLEDDHLQAHNLRSIMMQCRRALGDYAGAADLARDAVAINNDVFGPANEPTRQALRNAARYSCLNAQCDLGVEYAKTAWDRAPRDSIEWLEVASEYLQAMHDARLPLKHTQEVIDSVFATDPAVFERFAGSKPLGARQIAEAAWRLGRHDHADSVYAMIEQTLPDYSPLARSNLKSIQAFWAIDNGQPEDALAWCDALDQLRNQHAPNELGASITSLQIRVRALVYQGRYDEAEKALHRYIEIHGKNARTIEPIMSTIALLYTKWDRTESLEGWLTERDHRLISPQDWLWIDRFGSNIPEADH